MWMTKGNESMCHQLRREASVIRNEKREINYHTMYWKVSVKKIRRTVNVKGEPTVNGGKCTMERTSPRPCTITIPPSKTCTTGTTSKSLGISIVEDNTQAWVLCKRTVDKKMIGSVTEGALSIRTVTGQVGEMSAVGAIVSDTAVLWMTGSPLVTAGALVLRAVDTLSGGSESI